jgi:hypothetical protein
VKTQRNGGYLFPATGSAMSDGSFGRYGGIVYGYKKNRVFLWRPADTQSNGHMIYVGGVWGNGVKSIQEDTADVIVSILYFNLSGKTPQMFNFVITIIFILDYNIFYNFAFICKESCGNTCLVNEANINCNCTSGIERGPVTLNSVSTSVAYGISQKA